MATLIPHEMQPFVNEVVQNGSYPDEAAVLTAALKLLQQRHGDDLLPKIDAALDQSHRDHVTIIGRDSQHDAYFAGVRERAAQSSAPAK